MSFKKQYIDPDDLINNESFQAFVMNTCGKEEALQWEEYLQQQNIEEDFIRKNKDIIRLLSNSKKGAPLYSKEAARKALLKHIELESKLQEDFTNRINNRFSWQWLKVAAFLAIIVGIIASTYYFVSNRKSSLNNFLYTEIDVPAGEKTKITLADGTKVWINSESKLKYPNNYNISNRNIFLDGEAYFDVIHNKDLPFVVNTTKIKVQALGTQFNVKSYEGDRTFQTTVVSGSVLLEGRDKDSDISPLILKPNERATLSLNNPGLSLSNTKENIPIDDNQNIEKQKLIVAQVDSRNVISWKEHLLVFDNETLEELALKMSRWYKIDIEIGDTSLMDERYTGKFINNETVEDVLEAIKVTTPIYYTKKKDKIYIYKRN